MKQTNYEHMDYDLMIYSIASYRKVIYQTITLEMYYNYVYMHQYMMMNINNTANARKKTRQEFKFKHVVSKFDDLRLKINYKSLEIIMRLIGNNGELLNKYHTVIIVDDMANNVWQSAIPKEFYSYKTNIIAMKPTEFTLSDKGRSEIVLNNISYYHVDKWKNADTFFQRFAKIIHRFHLDPKHDCTNTQRLSWLEFVSQSHISTENTTSQL